MMRVLILLSLLALAKGQVEECGRSTATIRGRCYEMEVLVEDSRDLESLIVDRHTNVLYFISNYFDDSVANYLDLDTKEVGIITQVTAGSAFAVDQDRHEVYVTNNTDVHKFHYNNKTLEFVGSSGRYYVKSMFYKDALYYTTGHVRTLKNGESSEVSDMKDEIVTAYVIDKDDYQFFHTYTGLYGKMKGSENKDLYKGGIYTGTVTLDSSGTPYSCEYKSLYFINKDSKTLEKIGTLDGECYRLAFDKDDNIIYSTDKQIIKLKAIN